MLYAFARAFSVSALVVKEENIYYPVHRPRKRDGGGGGGRNRPGRGAGKSSRAANCPPSYPPYTLSHTLARNHPYPPLPLRCAPTRPSHPTRAIHPRCPPPSPPLHRPPPSPPLSASALSSRPPFLSAATASKALDYLPLISARVAHLLPRLPRLPRPKDQPPPLSSHALFRPSFSTLHLYFLPATTLDRLVPAVLPSFLRSVSKHLTAILINALTLLLHNYAHPLLDSNNTIS